MLQLTIRTRHSGRDCRSRQTALANPGHMDSSKLTIHGTGCPFPDGHDGRLWI